MGTVQSDRSNQLDYPRIYLYRRIVQAKLFIDNHYSQKINLDNISDEAFFSKFHFIRLFNTIYGKTPHQYLTAVRIAAARKSLSNGESVQHTCFEVGFESLSSFSTLFKKSTGYSPTHFRKQSLQRKEQMKKAPLRFVPGCFVDNYDLSKSQF